MVLLAVEIYYVFEYLCDNTRMDVELCMFVTIASVFFVDLLSFYIILVL